MTCLVLLLDPLIRYRAVTNSTAFNGCLSTIRLSAWGFKALIPRHEYINPSPVITKFLPGHDYRLQSTASVGVEIHFSAPMSCGQITQSLTINSTTSNNQTAKLDVGSITCNNVTTPATDSSPLSGSVNTTWVFAANLENVSDGIHQLNIFNATTADGSASTKVGQSDKSAMPRLD